MRGRRLALVAAAVLAALLAAVARGAATRDSITITANQRVAEDGQPTLLGGFVSSRRPGEPVTLEQDDCGPIPWHPVLQVETGDGGGWRGFANPDANSRYRVRWKKAVSRVITIKARPQLTAIAITGGIRVRILAFDFFNGRTVLLERLAPGTNRYRTIARTKVKRVSASGIYAASEGTFRTDARGTLRVRLPDDQARPCYTGGTSPPIRP